MLEPARLPLIVDDVSLDLPAAGRWRRRGVRILDGVSLSLAPGEILGIVGESGSGKTTLGKALAGLYAPARGTIGFGGAPGTRMGHRSRADRRRIQMVFQDPLSSFNPRRRVGASLRLALDLHGIGPTAGRADAVAGLLASVGLPAAHAARYPHELSGGQLQRVALARALAVEPEVIVADEAVSKLDVSVRAGILNLLKRTNAATGIGLVFITHDLEVARFLCHRVAVMYFGRVVEIGPAREVLGHPRHPYTAGLLAARAGEAPEEQPVGPPPRPDDAGCHVRGACPHATDRCARERPRLGALGVACHHPAPAPAPGLLAGAGVPRHEP